MKKLLFLYALITSWNLLFAQTNQKDPMIVKMVNEVSKDSLQSYVRTMVSFGTRNTLSTQTDPKRGIGAARNWVLSRFNEFAKQSGGRLTAIIDTTTLQKDGRRVDTTLLLGNVPVRFWHDQLFWKPAKKGRRCCVAPGLFLLDKNKTCCTPYLLVRTG